mmetsp:Transcript_4453/g.9647  ORF Transcript_4453/g.9647 Transcript_4453/m.9647 type:complete len:100 (+) Transcript_4453:187-486(+)
MLPWAATSRQLKSCVHAEQTLTCQTTMEITPSTMQKTNGIRLGTQSVHTFFAGTAEELSQAPACSTSSTGQMRHYLQDSGRKDIVVAITATHCLLRAVI